MSEIWENVQFWGVIVAIIAVIMGVVFNLINKRYQKKQLQVTTLFKVFDLLSSEDSRQARRFIYEERCRLLKDNKPVIFDRTDSVINMADKVKSSFDLTSVMVLNGLLDEDLFFKIYGGMIVRSWLALEEDIQNDWKQNKKHCENYRILKEKFEKRFTKEDMPHPYCIEKPS